MRTIILLLLALPVILILSIDFDTLNELQFWGVYVTFCAFIALFAIVAKHSKLFKNLNNKA